MARKPRASRAKPRAYNAVRKPLRTAADRYVTKAELARRELKRLFDKSPWKGLITNNEVLRKHRKEDADE